MRTKFQKKLEKKALKQLQSESGEVSHLPESFTNEIKNFI